MRVSTGTPHPLGASFDGTGTNFALFSAHAEKVELCLFDPSGEREVARVALPERTADIWHGRLDDVAPGQAYGYRVHGPYEPSEGHRFNPNKLGNWSGASCGMTRTSHFATAAAAATFPSTAATTPARCQRP
jgi:isoamylase